MRAATFALGLLLSLWSPRARADGPGVDEILEKVRRASALGLPGARAEVRLTSDDGRKEHRLSAATTTLPGGETRRLVRFLEPADVRGAAFLVVERPGEAAQRLLYLPSQKRVRRVSGGAGAGALMGTDFSYADLDLAGGAGDAHERLEDDTVEGQRCWVVATRPAGSSAYGRIVAWVHPQTGVALRVTFEDKAGKPVKRLEAKRVKQAGTLWYAAESVMETLGQGTRTTLAVTALDTKTPLAADDFTEQALERP
jgi:hypothetical protein